MAVKKENDLVLKFWVYATGLASSNYKLKKDDDYRFKQAMAFVLSKKGNVKEENEDCYNVVFHPENPMISLSAIADGVGSVKNAKEASLYAVNRLGMFFEESSVMEINDTFVYAGRLRDEFENISEEILESVHDIGMTTLTCAIMNEHDVIFVNVGDSRAYVYNGDYLYQVTTDDSAVYRELCLTGKILKDDFRFVKDKSGMDNCLGYPGLIPADIRVLSSDEIDVVMLATDGVTDIVSERDMKWIFKNNFVRNPDKIVSSIVDEAIGGTSEIVSEEAMYRIYEEGYTPLKRTIPGSDDATLVLTLTPKMM